MTTLVRRSWWLWASLQHLVLLTLGYWLAWLLRFDFVIPANEMSNFNRGLVIVISAKMVIAIAMGLRLERWVPHQGFADAVRLLGMSVLTSAVANALVFGVIGWSFPRSIYFLDPLVCFLLVGGARFAMRVYRETRHEFFDHEGRKGVLIYGAGVAGLTLAREIRSNERLGYRVAGFLDDDPHKRNTRLIGLEVFGTGDEAAQVVRNYNAKNRTKIEEIVVAMPSAPGIQVRSALSKAQAAGVHARIVPGLGELISGRLSVGKMKEISVTDLLGREPVELDREHVLPSVQGRCVLVTGAAGSIGSELSRQLSQLDPSRLVIFDEAESPLFFLENELRNRHPELDLVAVVGDVRDEHQVEEVIKEHCISAIYHAAAFKHVPMMERQICEAVRNNVIGTWNLVQAARRAKVENFVLISTDKAVNPSSIMGLTKRVAELIVSAQSGVGSADRRKYVAVRFGNVLISNGSVVPIFEKQIAQGGPVTVTHPDMRRYFMTVQEAVHLVLQAGALGQGSEVFLLDMGQPMKILDLARNMIRLAGFEPDQDIEIKIAGMRPGEKLFEELSLEEENTVPTSNPKIRSVRGRPMTMHEIAPWVADLQYRLLRRDPVAVLTHMTRLVPEYVPGGPTRENTPALAVPVAPQVVAETSAVQVLNPVTSN